MQLVAYGAQDIYLTGNPQITFFKVVYRRHTNFSMESIRQTFSGTQAFGADVTATISRNGDLVHRMYLEHDATFAGDANCGLVEHYGHSLIRECELEIGGQRIDRHTSMWNRVWSDLTEFNPNGHFGQSGLADDGNPAADGSTGTLYQLMTGNGIGLNNDSNHDSNELGVAGTTVNGFEYGSDGGSGADITVPKIFIPLNFWFCRNPGLALPLIALQYHEVKVKIRFEDIENLGRVASAGNFATITQMGTTNAPTSNFDLYCDYIYLDTDERRRFAQVSHEYLIEQLQFDDRTINETNPTIDLNFNHPVKELVWVARCTGSATGAEGRNAPGVGNDYTASPVSVDPVRDGTWQLKLNGHDRFRERDFRYFTRTQIWEHHTGYGSTPTFTTSDASLGLGSLIAHGNDGIGVYSFALKPEEHQPSGTCNFSRIDNAQLVGANLTFADEGATDYTPATTAPVSLTIFAVNYNVLRIMSGMGGLAYSN